MEHSRYPIANATQTEDYEMKKSTLVLTLAAVAMMAAPAFATGEPVEVVRGTAVIDGKLDDFKAAKPITVTYDMHSQYGLTVADGPKDNTVVFYPMYDDKFVYIGAKVTDDVAMFEKAGQDIWNSDAVEIWLGGLQFGISLSVEDGKVTVADWKGSEVSTLAALVKTAEGWNAEIKLSIADLAGLDVAVGKGLSIPFAVGINDQDVADAGREMQNYFPTDWTHSVPDSFAIATFK